MKRIFFAIVFILIAAASFSQNVGIGTTTPAFPLHVTSNFTRTGHFENTAANNDGIWGANTAAAGTGVGAGVVGITAQGGSGAAGVWGQNSNPAGIGVVGVNAAATGTGAGTGVVGITAQSGSGAAGVIGQNNHTNGTGIIGLGNASSTQSLVVGSGGAFTGTGVGLAGFATGAAGGTGVVGGGNNVAPGTLTAGSGAAFTGLSTGVFAKATGLSAGINQAIYTTNVATVANVAVNAWNGAQQFKILGNGSVSTIVKDINDKRVILYAPESPEDYFQDFGQGQLINGRAHIDLDPSFAKNVTINDKHPLRVFIQPEGDCKGTYVTNKTIAGFDVVELSGGTDNISFQWSITCNRADEQLANGYVSKNADARFGPAPVIQPETVQEVRSGTAKH